MSYQSLFNTVCNLLLITVVKLMDRRISCAITVLLLLMMSSSVVANYIPSSGYREGTYLSFNAEFTEGGIVLTDVNYLFEGEEHAIFSSLIIEADIEMEPGAPIPPMGTEGFRYTEQEFQLMISDSESGEICIKQLTTVSVDVRMELAEGVELNDWGHGYLTLHLSREHELTIEWSETTDIRVEQKATGTAKIEFSLGLDGIVETRVTPRSYGDPVTDRITIDGEGTVIEVPAGISIGNVITSPGDVEITVSSDVEGSRILQLNIGRELVGSEVNNLSDIRVSVDGEELNYMGSNEFYTTEEEGYYVLMVDDETHIFLRMTFSQHTIKVSEMPEAIDVSPTFNINGLLGLFIALTVVTIGAAVLFKKK